MISCCTMPMCRAATCTVGMPYIMAWLIGTTVASSTMLQPSPLVLENAQHTAKTIAPRPMNQNGPAAQAAP